MVGFMKLSTIRGTLLRRVSARKTSPLVLHSHRHFAHRAAMGDDILAGLDSTQISLMEEECILVDQHDRRIGSASKKICHNLENINKGMLHRAFSVFLFNTKGDLLLQQRSSAKITYPDHWTNTCCSHPLNVEAELDETEAVGVRRAAQRKLEHELGIPPKQVPVDDLRLLTKIHYKAANVPEDGRWGEHEIDYILFSQLDVDIASNDNEVQNYRYVSKEQLKAFIEESERSGTLITPWFKLIVNNFLYKWWDNLQSLDTVSDQGTIHGMTDAKVMNSL